jgi:hypothetical protein
MAANRIIARIVAFGLVVAVIALANWAMQYRLGQGVLLAAVIAVVIALSVARLAGKGQLTAGSGKPMDPFEHDVDHVTDRHQRP